MPPDMRRTNPLFRPVFGKVDQRYWSGRKKPWRVRLLRGIPWLQAVKWWHLLLLAAAAVVAATAWLVARPVADPDTRVVATVDGIAITEADLVAEGDGPVAADRRRGLIETVIERRLLADAAERQPGARAVDFQAAKQRAQETVQASAIARRLIGEVRADDAAARAYIAAHPAMFAERQLVLVDAGPIDPTIATGPALHRAETLAQADAALKPTGANFVHERSVIDTGSLPPELAARLARIEPGRLFALPTGVRVLLGAVIERAPLVIPPAIQLEQGRAGAVVEIRQARLKAALKAMRAKADIRIAG
jgi:hypothetical protein